MRRITLQAFVFLLIAIPVLSQSRGKIKSKETETRKKQPITAILGAFPDEITIILRNTRQQQQRIIQKVTFTEGNLHGKKVVIALTGIGKVNAAMVTTLLIEHYKPHEIIFSGIAGGVDTSLSPGDLVIAQKVAHHDYGTLTDTGMIYRGTRNPFTLRDNPIFFESDSLLIRTAQKAAKNFRPERVTINSVSVSPQIVTGNIVTGDAFVASPDATNLFAKKLNAAATEMEGAAVAQICWQQGSKFIVIRCLSDNANSRASLDVREFYQIAARNSAGLVMAMVELLHQ